MRALLVIVLVTALVGCKGQSNTPPGEPPAPPPPLPATGRAAPPASGISGQGTPQRNNKAGTPPGEVSGPAWVTNPSLPKSQYSERDNKLVPGKDKGLDTLATCKKSFDCRLNGQCSVVQGWCVVKSDADCAKTIVCEEEGRCHVGGTLPWHTICAAKSDDDCKKAHDCKNFGRCTLGQKGRCKADSDADCKASQVCGKEGKCKVAGGECVGSGSKGNGKEADNQLRPAEPAVKPIAKPIAEPAIQPAAKPAAKPAARRRTKPTARTKTR